MWLPVSSGSGPSVRVRTISLVVLVAVLVIGVDQNASVGMAQAGVPTQASSIAGVSESEPASQDDWAPPPAIADRVRAAVAERWSFAVDSIRIDWEEPARPIPPESEIRRLLGPGRAGSWIVLTEAVDVRSSIRFRAGVRVWTPVARIDLASGRTLAADDIEWAYAVSWGAPSRKPTGGSAAAGWETRRPVAAGEPLVPPFVVPPSAVRSGETVTARWTGGSVTIDVPAEALGSAARGESVMVRLVTGLRIRGIATDSQRVLLPGAGSNSGRGSTSQRAVRRRG